MTLDYGNYRIFLMISNAGFISSTEGLGFRKVVILGGSWVVIGRVISRITIVITSVRGLITLHRTTLLPKP